MINIIIIFIGAILGGIASMAMKRLSIRYKDNAHALVYQYISLIGFAFVILIGFVMI